MLTLRAIRREYDEAGSVNALLALWAFVDDGTFVTKAGDVGVVYRLQGQDCEGLDHRPAATRRPSVRSCATVAGRAQPGVPVFLQTAGSADDGGTLRIGRR